MASSTYSQKKPEATVSEPEDVRKPAIGVHTSSFWFKASLLILLAVQNCLLNICARWSRVIAAAPSSGEDTDESGHGGGAVLAGGYAKTSLIVVVEAVKIAVSVAFLAGERGRGLGDAWAHLVQATKSQPLEVLKLVVPSALYVLQNNLILVGADNLEGPVIAVLGQLKIVSTAAFSVGMLGRSLHPRQWVALGALVAGVSAVQLSTMGGASRGAGDGGHRNGALGVTAVCAAAATSGFAGVYFEKVLKGSDMSVWVRNVHMALFGVVAGLGGLLTQPGDRALVAANGFLGGYGAVVWALVAVQAGGGLLVAAVVKYTDNILKAFATSASLVAVSVASILFFNFPLSAQFTLGAALVIYSMFLYGDALPAYLLPPGLAPAGAPAPQPCEDKLRLLADAEAGEKREARG